MHRDDFRKLFKTCGPAVVPVVHAQTTEQVARNVRIATAEGAQGVFLINHDFPHEQLLPIIKETRAAFPALWLGVNFLAVTGRDAFPVLGELAGDGVPVDAYWADNARIDENASANEQAEARDIRRAREQSGWQGMYFGGTAFKKQRKVAPEQYPDAARIAAGHVDIVTTSGVATGQAASVDKIAAMRRGCGDVALALASGITPDNAHLYCRDVDCFMAATGINTDGDFYNIEPLKLRRLLAAVRRAGARAEPSDRWYLPLMAPNTKGDKFAWLDPSSLYINARTFNALLDDLLQPFSATEIDVVCGIDAMGFVLGSALATRLGKGFLPLRKAGKIPLDSDAVAFANYSGKTQNMELRRPAFRSGTRVLLVDQWVETGGTMNAAIELIERQRGIVAGMATVCIEEAEKARAMRAKYKCSTAVVPGTTVQDQCNKQCLESFAGYDPETVFPETPS